MFPAKQIFVCHCQPPRQHTSHSSASFLSACGHRPGSLPGPGVTAQVRLGERFPAPRLQSSRKLSLGCRQPLCSLGTRQDRVETARQELAATRAVLRGDVQQRAGCGLRPHGPRRASRVPAVPQLCVCVPHPGGRICPAGLWKPPSTQPCPVGRWGWDWGRAARRSGAQRLSAQGLSAQGLSAPHRGSYETGEGRKGRPLGHCALPAPRSTPWGFQTSQQPDSPAALPLRLGAAGAAAEGVADAWPAVVPRLPSALRRARGAGRFPHLYLRGNMRARRARQASVSLW